MKYVFIRDHQGAFPVDLMCQTLGVVEPMNDQNEQFGMDRLQSIIIESNGMPEEILEKVDVAIQTFTRDAPQFDDMTFLVFKVL